LENIHSLPVHAVDFLKRTDDAALVIQQKFRKILLQDQTAGYGVPPSMGTVVEAALWKTQEDMEEQETENAEGIEEEDECTTENETPTPGEAGGGGASSLLEEGGRDWSELYSLLLVAVFSFGMLVQRTVSKLLGLGGGNETTGDDLEHGINAADLANAASPDGFNYAFANLGGAAAPPPP
jgi:hypothetical protein